MTSPVTYENGKATWTHWPGDLYVITGTDTHGKRFKAIYTTSWRHAAGFNIYNGTKWLLRDGRRYRIVTVRN